ncbi:hypothetical protein Q8A73_009154 [Channa argus]|nr:hypothetical protein Q8A73_009154 [Channa argus]
MAVIGAIYTRYSTAHPSKTLSRESAYAFAWPADNRGNLFPLLSSQKGFPSASDYLWLQLVSRQPSGPVWRLQLSLLSPDGSQGGMEERRGGWGEVGERDMSELGGQTLLEDSKGWVLADTAMQSQETRVKEKGTHENNVTPDLGSVPWESHLGLFYFYEDLSRTHHHSLIATLQMLQCLSDLSALPAAMAQQSIELSHC